MKPISAFAKLQGYYCYAPYGKVMGNLEPVGAVFMDGQGYDLYAPTPEVEHLPKVYVDGYKHTQRAITVEDIHPYFDFCRYAGVISVETKILFSYIPNTGNWNATFLPANEDEANRIIKWAKGTWRTVSVGAASITHTHTPAS
ncbi:MAG: hypothetical protein D6750_10595 [Bacteroidetes bacterium]|nr:MAG: hypothetical protein D6750_10595 [Bacteroidota bacterium]